MARGVGNSSTQRENSCGWRAEVIWEKRAGWSCTSYSMQKHTNERSLPQVISKMNLDKNGQFALHVDHKKDMQDCPINRASSDLFTRVNWTPVRWNASLPNAVPRRGDFIEMEFRDS